MQPPPPILALPPLAHCQCAECIVSVAVSKKCVYSPPRCLNMEPQGNQEFLEANVTVSGNQLALSHNSKVAVDALYRLPPYQRPRQGVPSKVYVSNSTNRRMLQGILTRIMQSTSSDELTVAVLAMQFEA